jgi:hypothetical protein
MFDLSVFLGHVVVVVVVGFDHMVLDHYQENEMVPYISMIFNHTLWIMLCYL